MTSETADALHEMMTVAARELAGYEGPIVVEVIPDADSRVPKYLRDDEEFSYAQYVA